MRRKKKRSKPGPKKRVFSRLTVSLGEGQREALRRLAAAEDMTLAQIVRRALKSFMDSAPMPKKGRRAKA